MSGIYIKGMEMPKSCRDCEWRDAEAGGDCELMICNPFETYTEQYKHCPFQVISKRHSLVPVPEHGRSIDADALLNLLNHCMFPSDMVTTTAVSMATNWIQNAPTVIPAEEGET